MIAQLALGAVLLASAPAEAPRPSPTPSPASSNPCRGPSALLAMLNRPTIGYSTCAVRDGRSVLEEGYQNTALGDGRALVQFPQGFERFGVGGGWEIDAFGPAYNAIAGDARAQGLSDWGGGFKYQLPMRDALQLAVDGLYTPPNGTAAFSAGGASAIVNLDAAYPISPVFGIGTTLAIERTAAREPGGLMRYTVFQPSIVLTAATPASQLYFEYVASSNVGPGLGGRAFVDYGIQQLIGARVELDAEVGSTFTANRALRFHYLGVGIGLELGRAASP